MKVNIIATEPGMGRLVNPFDGNYSPGQYDDFEETVKTYPCFLSDGITPVPFPFKGEGELVYMESSNNWLSASRCQIIGNEYVCSTGYEQKLCYIATEAPTKAEKIKCNCACHSNHAILHFMPCCVDGWIAVTPLSGVLKSYPTYEENAAHQAGATIGAKWKGAKASEFELTNKGDAIIHNGTKYLKQSVVDVMLKMTKSQASEVKEDKWVRVEDDLPDEYTDVEFYNAGYKRHFIGRLYDRVEKTFWDQQADTHTKVSHWRHLTPPNQQISKH